MFIYLVKDYCKIAKQTTNNEEKQPSKKRKFKLLKWVLSSLGVLILAASLFIYFFLGSYLKSYLEETIQNESNGTFNLVIEKIDIDFFQANINVKNAVLTCDTNKWNEEYLFTNPHTPKLNFNIKDVQLSNIRWFNYLTTDSLSLQSIEINTGEVDINAQIRPDSLKKDFKTEFRAIVLGITPYLEIDSLKAKKINFSYYGFNDKDTLTARGDDLKIFSSKLIVDSSFVKFKSPLFFSDTLNIDVQNLSFSKNELELSAKTMSFNSIDTVFAASEIDIIKDNKNQFSFPSINIFQLRLQQFITSNELLATKVVVTNPTLNIKQLISGEIQQKQLKSNIIKKVNNSFNRVYFEKFMLEGGNVSYRKKGATARKSYLLNADSVSLAFHQFNIDSTTYKDTSSIFFSDFIFIGLKKISYIKDDSTKLLIANFETSSLDTNLFLRKIYYSKGDDLEVSIPSAELLDINWKKYWHESFLEIDQLNLNYPSISVFNDKRKIITKRSIAQSIGDISAGVKIKSLHIHNGDFKNQIIGISKGVNYQTANNIRMSFYNINLRPEMDRKEAEKALFGSLRTIRLRQLYVSTVHKEVIIKADAIRTLSNYKNIIASKVAFEKSPNLQTEVASISFNDINWKRYWSDENVLDIDQVLIEQPSIKLTNVAVKTDSTSKPLKETIPSIVGAFANSLSINKIELKDGLLESYITDSSRTDHYHKASNIAIKLDHLNITYDTIPQRTNFLFSESIALSLQDYIYISENKEIKVNVKKLDYSPKDSLFTLKNVNIQNGTKLKYNSPKTTISSLKWDILWNDDIMHVKRIQSDEPKIKIHLTKNNKEKNEPIKDQINEVIKKTIPISIDEMSFVNGTLDFKHTNEHGTSSQFADKLNLNVLSIAIDTNSLAKESHLFLAENANFSLSYYKYTPRDNAHRITVNKIRGNTADSSLSIKNIRFKIASKVFIYSPDMSIKQFDFQDFINGNSTTLGSLTINNPVVELRVDKSLTKPIQVKAPSIFNLRDSLPSFIGKFTPKIDIKNIYFKNGTFEYESKIAGKITTHTSDSIYINAQKMIIHDDAQKNSEKNTFFSENIDISLKNYSLIKADSSFKLLIDQFEAHTKMGTISAYNINYIPQKRDPDYWKTTLFRKTQFDFNIPEIQGENMDFYRLVHEQEFDLGKLILKNPYLNVFEDKRIDKDPNYIPPMPNDIFINMPFYLNVSEVICKDGKFVYTEKEKREEGLGTITFDHTNIDILNVTNDPIRMSRATPATLTGNCKFMNEGNLKINEFHLSLLEEELYCTYSGKLGAMNAIYLNRILEPNTGVSLKSGEINNITFNAKMIEENTTGGMEAKFKKLRLVILSSKNNNSKRIVTKLVNLVLPNKSKSKRQGKINYTKESTDGFIRTIWQSIKSGLTNTIIPLKNK